MASIHSISVSSTPSFSLGLDSLFDSVTLGAPIPPLAVEMEVDVLPPVLPLRLPEDKDLATTLLAAPTVENGLYGVPDEDFLKELDQVFCQEWIEPTVQHQSGSISVSKEFLAPDDKFRNTVAEGGDNPSKNQNRWALNRLKKFREHLGQDTSVDLVDLPPIAAVDLLSIFFEQVTKQNGDLYPSGSLMNLLGGFNRILRRKQEERIMASGVDEAPFSMKTSPLYRRVCVACVMAMRRSRAKGVGTERKLVKVVAKKTETNILADSSMAKTHSRGLFRRVGYYCMFRFSIRGGGELHRLARADFSFGLEGNSSKFIQYHERTSKNGKATMTKFQPEHFRPAVKNFEADVVDTFERYYKHLPEGMTEFFLAVIDNPRTSSWYSRSPMGERSLALLVKQIFEENGLDPDDFSNKSGRTTLVTRMAEAGVPADVGMLVTGHNSEKAYGRYDRSKEAKVRAAQRCATEEALTFVQALNEETTKLRSIIIDGTQTDAASLESPPKRLKSSDEGDTSAKDLMSMKLTALKIRDGHPTDDRKGKNVRKIEDVENPSEWEWMKHFDWENDLKLWEEGKSVQINPISGLLGKLVNCDGLTINFNGPINFKC